MTQQYALDPRRLQDKCREVLRGAWARDAIDQLRRPGLQAVWERGVPTSVSSAQFQRLAHGRWRPAGGRTSAGGSGRRPWPTRRARGTAPRRPSRSRPRRRSSTTRRSRRTPPRSSTSTRSAAPLVRSHSHESHGAAGLTPPRASTSASSCPPTSPPKVRLASDPPGSLALFVFHGGLRAESGRVVLTGTQSSHTITAR